MLNVFHLQRLSTPVTALVRIDQGCCDEKEKDDLKPQWSNSVGVFLLDYMLGGQKAAWTVVTQGPMLKETEPQDVLLQTPTQRKKRKRKCWVSTGS